MVEKPAQEDVLGLVMARFQTELEGYSDREAWYITDADRHYPDLRCIANGRQLRRACAYRALFYAVGRSHERASDTLYSIQRDHFNEEYEKAMASLVLAFKSGSGDDADSGQSISVIYQDRA